MECSKYYSNYTIIGLITLHFGITLIDEFIFFLMADVAYCSIDNISVSTLNSHP